MMQRQLQRGEIAITIETDVAHAQWVYRNQMDEGREFGTNAATRVGEAIGFALGMMKTEFNQCLSEVLANAISISESDWYVSQDTEIALAENALHNAAVKLGQVLYIKRQQQKDA